MIFKFLLSKIYILWIINLKNKFSKTKVQLLVYLWDVTISLKYFKRKYLTQENSLCAEVYIHYAHCISNLLDILDLAWSPLDNYLATCSIDNSIVIWNALKFPGKIDLTN